MEKNESLEGAAIRELEEETGLVVGLQDIVPAGYIEYEFLDPGLVPHIMQVRQI